MAISITAPRERRVCDEFTEPQRLVTPGATITADTDFMRGHGTYMEEDELIASVAGVVETVNKLISVRPLKTRYNGEVGDVIVGRIQEVGQKRWKVDVNSRLNAILMLSAVNLPGGELRKRSAEDELKMRQYLTEGDLISAEVQSVFSDGALSLHTRSLKYGKLGQGIMVRVSPSLIKRRKTHFHNLTCGASIILGNNGYVWISRTPTEEEEAPDGGFIQNLEPVLDEDRRVLARLRNCVLGLADHRMMLYDTSVIYTYNASEEYPVADLLNPDVMKEVILLVRQKLSQEAT
ncbi:exosome complex component RRP4-like [Lytechinus pictus]|uniref:exosome complex component RRP4-like n=1 Tax=Lytechinus pictus TaxID=7653 RepID=UPI0030B9F4AF